MTSVAFNCIAARCKNGGIGYKGDLPWPRIKRDMKFLKEKSTRTQDPTKQNAVIMGRLTWDSYPAHLRPLPNRFSIVLSRKHQSEIEGHPNMVCSSLSEAVVALEQQPLASKIESVYIFGGEGVFREAMMSPLCKTLYITEIFQDFPSDVFFPPIDSTTFSLIENHGDPLVPTGEVEENGVKYKFTVYQRTSAELSQ